jgi:hypothetical protein
MDFSRRRMLHIIILITASLFSASLAQASASWPNEPAGAKQILDFPFNTLDGNGLVFYGGNANVVTDNSAQGSPNSVVQYTYQQGFVGGIAAAKHYMPLGNSLKELFVGYWWKPSAAWQGHISNGNKINFLMAANRANLVIEMYGPPSGPFGLSVYLPFFTSNGHLPNSYGDNPGTRHLFGNNVKVQLGTWHRVELYVKHSTTPTSRDGIIRWWMDGVLCGNYTTVNYSPDPWVEFQFSPTWGGVGDVKSKTDYFWYDHVHISAPSGGSTVSDQPPGPPTAPRILNVTVQ